MNRLIPPGAESRFVQLPEGSVRVLIGGASSCANVPALLIHGGGTDNAGISWYRAFAALGTERRLIAIDLPGFGASRDIEPLGGPERMSDFVVRVARELGLTEAVIVGVSMGGDVAMNVALRHPRFTSALVLIAPGGLAERVGGPVTHYFSWIGAQLPDWILLPLARIANRFTRAVLNAIVADPATLPPEVGEEFVREARSPGAGIAYGRYNQATLGRNRLLNNLLPRVHEITVPTLLFHGEKDAMVNPVDSQRAADLIPNAKLVLVPNVGHWAHLEAHDLFTKEAQQHLSALDNRAAVCPKTNPNDSGSHRPPQGSK